MDTTEWEWVSRDGLKIYSKAWAPAGNVKGIACFLHGVGDHIGRYEKFGEALTAAGYVLAGFDQRGFGKSEGRRGHTPSLDMYLDDIDSFLGEITQQYPEKPLFLCGESMGGILALAHTPIRQPSVFGVVVFVPALKTALQEQKFKVLLAKMLGTIFPTLTIESGLDVEELSRDPQVAVDFVNDPLTHFKVTLGWGKIMMDTIDLVYENAHRFPKPLLIMHGSKDQIAYPSGSQLFAEHAPKDKVTLKMWEGFKHDLITDPESADVFSTMIEWMDKQNTKQVFEG